MLPRLLLVDLMSAVWVSQIGKCSQEHGQSFCCHLWIIVVVYLIYIIYQVVPKWKMILLA